MPKTSNIPTFYCKAAPANSDGLHPLYFIARKNGLRYKVYPGEMCPAPKWKPDARGKGNGRARSGINDRDMLPLNDRLDKFEARLRSAWEDHFPNFTPASFRELVLGEEPAQTTLPLQSWMAAYVQEPGKAMRILSELRNTDREELFAFIRKMAEDTAIRQAAYGKETAVLTFSQFADQFISSLFTAKTTKNRKFVNRHYRSSQKHFAAFAEVFGPFDFDDIGWDFLERFKEFAFSGYDLEFEFRGKKTKYHKDEWEQNTAAANLKRLKKLVNEARKAGHTNNTIVNERGFSIPWVDGNAAVIYEADVRLLDALDLSGNARLSNVRNLTFRAYSTGLRYSDWHKITPERVQWIGAEKVLNIRTKKTGSLVSIPVLPFLDRCLSEPAPDVISNQKYNDYIKELLELAGITRLIDWTTHVAGERQDMQVRLCDKISAHDMRRSGLTALALRGVPDRVLRIISGHSTDAQLHKYLRLGDKLAVLQAVN